MKRAIGVDFGTTNSALAIVDGEGEPQLARFARADGSQTSTFRSVVYLELQETGPGLLELAGPRAIDAFLQADEPGRLMQSLKSFLARRDFSATSVLGQSYRLEGLIAVILRELRLEAEAGLGELGGPVVVGRPVRFAGSNAPDAADFALKRLQAAFRNAGFGDVAFEFEPIAAAYHYERTLDHDELLLIADFGGGTSDFSLVRVGPERRRLGLREEAILGTDGVALAGDAFDGRIVRHVVAPVLGMGTRYRSMFGRELPIPSWLFTHLQRWHHLSFLKSPRTLHLLYELVRDAIEPKRIEALLHLVEQNLGFQLHRSVEQTKLGLSEVEEGSFVFGDGAVAIDEPVSRREFDDWIAPDVEAIESCLDGLLEAAGVAADDVDCVFMTGGTSLVPAVRALFLHRFGVGRIRSGQELTSVASGLALRARELARGSL